MAQRENLDVAARDISAALQGILQQTRNFGYDLPKITGERGDTDYRGWLRQLRYAIEKNGWSTRHAVMMVQSCCVGKARAKVSNLGTFENDPTPDQLLAELAKRFGDPSTILGKYFRVRNLQQGDDETLEQYSARCDQATKGMVDKDFAFGAFVQGLKEQTMKDECFRADTTETKDTVLKKLLAINVGIMNSREESKSRKPPARPKLDSDYWAAAKAMDPDYKKEFYPYATEPEPMEVDAVRRRDPKQQSMCYYCGSKGHWIKDCWIKQNREAKNFPSQEVIQVPVHQARRNLFAGLDNGPRKPGQRSKSMEVAKGSTYRREEMDMGRGRGKPRKPSKEVLPRRRPQNNKLGRLREMGDKKMEELSDTSEDEQDQQYPSNNNLTPSDWDDSDLDQDDQEENRQDFH